MVTVYEDGDAQFGGGTEYIRESGGDEAVFVKDLRERREVGPDSKEFSTESLFEVASRFHRDPVDPQARFLAARELARQRMELRIGRENPRFMRETGKQTVDEFVGVRR